MVLSRSLLHTPKGSLRSATPRLCRMASLTRRLYPEVRGRDRPGDNGNAHRWPTKPGGRHRVTSVLKENLRYVDVLDVRLSRQTPPTNASTPAPGTELSAVVPLSSRCWIVIIVLKLYDSTPPITTGPTIIHRTQLHWSSTPGRTRSPARLAGMPSRTTNPAP